MTVPESSLQTRGPQERRLDPANGQGSLVSKIWIEKLEAANSEGEIVEVAREYIGTLSAGDIERLPKPCRPPRFLSAADVTAFSDTLVRHDCIVDGATARLVGRMCDFFSAATLRLTALKAGMPGPA